MDRTRQTLQDAIDANHAAQEAVRKQLEMVVKRKKQNRRKAAAAIAPLQTPIITTVADNTKQRPWTRSFFADENGSVPEPNEDTSLRRDVLEKDKSFIQQSPLWTKKEISEFYKLIAKQETTLPATIDFAKVASDLAKKTKRIRSAQECRVKYQPDQSPISKEESLSLLKQHHGNDGHEELSLPGRTKWQAFQAFRRAADDKKDPWTLEQDQVLFRTVAAAGPQQVLDQHFASHLSDVLKKNPKAILQRTMTSLLNPKFANDLWSEDDERRLCLLMKVYRDVQSPFVSVSSHFQNRGSRSVHDKWTRTLAPKYEAGKRFTKQEDDKLRQLTGRIDWKALEQEFPGRQAQSLAKRWKDIASKEQVVQVYSQNLKRKFKEFHQDDVVVRVKPLE